MSDKKIHALNRVIEATCDMILEMPFADISIAAIAAKARCSSATIYEIYETKDNLYVDALGQLLLHWAPPEPVSSDGNAFQDVLAYARMRIDYFANPKTRALFRALRESCERGAVVAERLMSLRASFGSLVGLVEHAFAQDDLRRTDAECVAYLIVGTTIYEALASSAVYGIHSQVDPSEIMRKLFTPLVTDAGMGRLQRFIESLPHQSLGERLPLATRHTSKCRYEYDATILRQTLLDLGIPAPHMPRN